MFVNNINPILFEWNFISVRWYGIFLSLGLLLSILIIIKFFKEKKISLDLALDLIIWLTIGGLLGARLGHIIFYELEYYLHYPKEIIFINHGGLSSHGLAIGLIITFFLFTKLKKINWRQILDLLIIPIPLLAGFIRLGNFFNSEIIGRTTDLPWVVRFPLAETNPLWRHPSQIYEALIVFIIFIILWVLYKKKKDVLRPLFLTHLFLLLYFGSRFLVEFVKEYHILSPENFLTMGQYLSIPFILWAVIWFIIRKR